MGNISQLKEVMQVSSYNDKISAMMDSYQMECPEQLVGLYGGFPRSDENLLKSLVDKIDEVSEELNGDPLRVLRVKLLLEEVSEYLEAEAEGDIVEVADALGDIKVIGQGTALAYGIDLDAVDEEIFQSNMSKVDPDTGTVLKRDDGKVVKPESYFPPNIKAAIGLDQPVTIESIRSFWHH